MRPHTTNNLEPECANPSSCTQADIIKGGPDGKWLHLHRGVEDTSRQTLTLKVVDGSDVNTAVDDLEIRYTTFNGVPLSPWIRGSSDPTFSWEFDVDTCCGAQGDLDTILPEDGVFDLTVELQVYGGLSLSDYKPYPIFLHLNRQNEEFPTSTLTPAGIDEPDYPDDGGASTSFFAPTPAYVDFNDVVWTGYPADPTVEAWDGDALSADLIVEPLTAGRTALFEGSLMWWADPAHKTSEFPFGQPFIRAFPPKHAEAITGDLRVFRRHERFPARDGPRGVGWMSSYVSGQVDSQGRFAFAETSGRLAWLLPDGEIFTIAGHVTHPEKLPVWYKKGTAIVRQNQELRGTWTNGQYFGEDGGFRMPTDVAIDPFNEQIFYVAGYEDNVIWKVTINSASPALRACDIHDVSVEVFAGQLDHSRGTADGTGTEASFSGPSSVVFDSVADVLYVADQDTSRIRMITREGVVTTLFGLNSVEVRGGGFGSQTYAPDSVQSACSSWWLQECAKPAANLEGAAPFTPDIFVPHAIRTDSRGNIILLEHGFGTIREINPSNGATKVLGRVDMKHTEWDRGWAWMDVDKWGTTGEVDTIYWTKTVGEVFRDSHGPNRGDPGCTFMYKGLTCDEAISRCNGQGDYVCPENQATNMFSESYGFIPPSNAVVDGGDGKSHLLFNTDKGQLPGMYHDARRHDPNHYGWLIAVDPRGALLYGGLGQHGIQRIRMKKSTDVISAERPSTSWDHFFDFWQGRRAWDSGHPQGQYGYEGPLEPAISLSAKFGHHGHNLLGFDDTWGHVGDTDEELIAAFDIPESITSDPTVLDQVMHFLRSMMGTTPEAAPVPVAYPPVCASTATSASASSSPTTTTSSSSGTSETSSTASGTTTATTTAATATATATGTATGTSSTGTSSTGTATATSSSGTTGTEGEVTAGSAMIAPYFAIIAVVAVAVGALW